MTNYEALAWTVTRSIVVSSVGLLVSRWVHRSCTEGSYNRGLFGRRVLIVAAVLPLFVPDLLVGFSYRLTSMRLTQSDLATESLYASLLVFRIISLQFLVRLLLPNSAVSAESVHSLKMMKAASQSPPLVERIRLMIVGPFRTPVTAWLIGCLFCFQEFETVSLLQVNRHPIAWSVWLFDAHAAGEPLSNSLWFAAVAVVLQLALVIPVFLLINTTRDSRIAMESTSARKSNGEFLRAMSYLLVGAGILLLIVVPLMFSVAPAGRGFVSLIEQNALLSRIGQILLSIVPSAIASILSLWLSSIVMRTHRWIAAFTALPGLYGSLIVGLGVLGLFQLPGLRTAYDTWIPMVLGQSLWLIPRAMLLLFVLKVLSPEETRHTARLLQSEVGSATNRSGRDIDWRLGTRNWMLAFAALTHWAFWDVSIVTMLRPVRFEPMVTRLYNEMHYGRTDTLLSMTLAATILPLLLSVIATVVAKQIFRLKAVFGV